MDCRFSPVRKLAQFPIAFLLACVSCPLPVFPNAAGVTDLAGNSVDPFQLASGKVVILIFVRTDCPVSNRYAPEIQRLSSAYSGKAQFFLVYIDKKETAEAIRNHNQEYKYNLIALRDLQHSLVKQSSAQITPEAGVFDATRRLIYHGRIDNLYEDFSHSRKSATTHELEDAVRSALSGKPLTSTSSPAVGCYISDLE